MIVSLASEQVWEQLDITLLWHEILIDSYIPKLRCMLDSVSKMDKPGRNFFREKVLKLEAASHSYNLSLFSYTMNLLHFFYTVEEKQ